MSATVANTEPRSVGLNATTTLRCVAVRAMALAIGLGPIAAGHATASAQGSPAAVGVDLAKMVSLSETAPIIGQLVAPTRSTLAARVAGVVSDVAVEIGDAVSGGDLLVVIDRERLEIARNAARASRAQAQASVTTAQASFDLARQAFERLEQLRGSAAFSRGQFDDAARRVDVARSAIAEAEARLAAAEAALSEADYNLTHTQVRAPVSGTIIDRQAQVGQYLTVGAPVITVLDNSKLEIEANVPATLICGLERGIEVRVSFDGAIAGRHPRRICRHPDTAGAVQPSTRRYDHPAGGGSKRHRAYSDRCRARGADGAEGCAGAGAAGLDRLCGRG